MISYYQKNKEKVLAQNKIWRSSHKVEMNNLVKQWAINNPDRMRSHWLKCEHGISLEDYNKKLEEQNGKCAICGGVNKNGRNLAVDHNHATGQLRGLLCSNCNRGIGLLQDDPCVLDTASEYLRKYKGETNER